MSDSEKDQHKKSDSCYACGIEFGTTQVNEKTKKEEKVIKCADHCHISQVSTEEQPAINVISE